MGLEESGSSISRLADPHVIIHSRVGGSNDTWYCPGVSESLHRTLCICLLRL